MLDQSQVVYPQLDGAKAVGLVVACRTHDAIQLAYVYVKTHVLEERRGAFHPCKLREVVLALLLIFVVNKQLIIALLRISHARL